MISLLGMFRFRKRFVFAGGSARNDLVYPVVAKVPRPSILQGIEKGVEPDRRDCIASARGVAVASTASHREGAPPVESAGY